MHLPYELATNELDFSICKLCDDTNISTGNDYYQICVITGPAVIQLADQRIETTDTILLVVTPRVAVSITSHSPFDYGYACYFKAAFFQSDAGIISQQQFQRFKSNYIPVVQLNKQQQVFFEFVFDKMRDVQADNFIWKKEIIVNYISLLMLEVLRIQNTDNYYLQVNAASRITTLFLNLLDMQFPAALHSNDTIIKSPGEFADRLSIHVNHLNYSVKQVTGKSTKKIITDRLIHEALALLQGTDWTISEIAFALGFEYPSYFSSFFKQKTGISPTSLRS